MNNSQVENFQAHPLVSALPGVFPGDDVTGLARISGVVDGVEVAAHVPQVMADDRPRAESWLRHLRYALTPDDE